MMGFEIHDDSAANDIKENKALEITSSGINPDNVKKFWNDTFGKEMHRPSFEDLRREMLGRSEEEFDFDIGPDEAAQTVLERFEPKNWESLDIDEKHESVKDLVKCISDLLELPEPPALEFFDGGDNLHGFYSEHGNYIGINDNYINDAKEIINTVAHETRHAYQHNRAEILEQQQDEIYKFNFEHYIAPSFDEHGFCVNFNDYYDQYVEAEARAFAIHFFSEVTL